MFGQKILAEHFKDRYTLIKQSPLLFVQVIGSVWLGIYENNYEYQRLIYSNKIVSISY